MLILADKTTLFQDRYQVLVVPVPTSGVFRHRQLLRLQTLYPEFYAGYKQACDRGELRLGDILVYQTERDLAGLGVGGALSKPKFIVAMAVTEFAENLPHQSAIKRSLVDIQPLLMNWGRYDGIRRVAVVASDTLLQPNATAFEAVIVPLLAQYLQPVRHLNLIVYH